VAAGIETREQEYRSKGKNGGYFGKSRQPVLKQDGRITEVKARMAVTSVKGGSRY